MSEASARWNKAHPEERRAADARYYAKLKEQNKRIAHDEMKCIGCGVVYKRDDAIIKGFRFFHQKSYKCLCTECAPNSKRAFYNLSTDE